MRAYRTSTKIKLGLIAAAVAIAVASLVFTNRLADRLEAQDEAAVELWARAIEFQSRIALQQQVPDVDAVDELERLVLGASVTDSVRLRLAAVARAASEPPSSEGLDFVFTQIVEPARFSVPAILTDSAGTVASGWRNIASVPEGSTRPDAQALLLALAEEMDTESTPIRLDIAPGLVQVVHYGESPLARMIRLFPFVQLGVVSLFVLVGYLGFSYVRRSEQAGLWVGMAREAAHQLGTPLTSLIGWTELLRMGEGSGIPPETIADELDQDVERLQRVAHRFEKIGSTPDLEPAPLAPTLERVASYVRRRMPSLGQSVRLTVDAPADLEAELNPELFEWVVENLLKNALDAMDGVRPPPDGHDIAVIAIGRGSYVEVRVRDTGKGMDRATARHVFRPGFSTKRRGWGLGLSLARRIVEDYHGGELTVEASRPGEGTTFLIRLRV